MSQKQDVNGTAGNVDTLDAKTAKIAGPAFILLAILIGIVYHLY